MATMKQCKTCMNREFKDKLFCCAVADLFHAFRELLKCLPFFGKDIKTYECGSYMADNRMHPAYNCALKHAIAAVDKQIKQCEQDMKRGRL